MILASVIFPRVIIHPLGESLSRAEGPFFYMFKSNYLRLTSSLIKNSFTEVHFK